MLRAIGLLTAAFAAALQSSALAASLRDIAVAAGEPPLAPPDCIPYQLPACYDYSEPSIAVSPVDNNHIAVVAFAGNWGPNASAPVWKSDDQGATWRRVLQIPQPSPGVLGPGDQKVTFDDRGRLYLAELGRDEEDNLHDYIFRQLGKPDDPLTPGISYGDDQPHLDVDSTAGPCRGAVYSPWLDTQHYQANTVLSTDLGLTVTDHIVGDVDKFENRTARIAVSTDGHAYIVYKTREGSVANSQFEYTHYYVKRSDDCGNTWSALGQRGQSVTGTRQAETFFTGQFGNTTKGMIARSFSSDDWISVDKSGNVYVAYVNVDSTGFAQIYLAISHDHGATWTSSRATDGQHNSGFPEVAATATESVGVLYVDYDDSQPATVFRQRFARLKPPRTQWLDELLQNIKPGLYLNAEPAYIWGDYEGLAAVGSSFCGVFTGESIGRPVLQLDPIFFKEAE